MGTDEVEEALANVTSHCHDLFEAAGYNSRLLTQPPYIINRGNWEQILEGKIAPLSAIMRGKLKLAKGSMTTLLLKYVTAAKEIVVSAQQLDSEIPQAFFDDF